MRKLLSILLILFTLQTSAEAAITFDGTNDALQTAGNVTIGSTKLSISVWMYINAFANDNATCLESTSGEDGFSILPNFSTGLFYLEERGNTRTRTATFTRPSPAAWHHYIFYFDKNNATADIRVWVDGTQQTLTQAQPGGISNNNFATTIWYFMSRATTSRWIAGRMSELAAFNRLLTTGEIAQLYNGGTTTKYLPNSIDRTALFMYLPMDEATSGTVNSGSGFIRDWGPNGNHATQANGLVYSAEPANLPYKTQLFKATDYSGTYY